MCSSDLGAAVLVVGGAEVIDSPLGQRGSSRWKLRLFAVILCGLLAWGIVASGGEQGEDTEGDCQRALKSRAQSLMGRKGNAAGKAQLMERKWTR